LAADPDQLSLVTKNLHLTDQLEHARLRTVDKNDLYKVVAGRVIW